MPAALIAKAEELADWLEEAVRAGNRHPELFLDLQPTLERLKLALFFLRKRWIPELHQNLSLPLTAVVCGGTNTGKSTLINSLFQKIYTRSGGLASLTKHLIVLGDEKALKALAESRALTFPPSPSLAVQEPREPDSPSWFSCPTPSRSPEFPVLIDTPDIDSSDTLCRQRTREALALADILVWVTTQQKYRDQSGMTFLDQAMKLTYTRLDIFNQALDSHSEAIEDLRQTYDLRWPKNERYFLRLAAQRNLAPDGMLEPLQMVPVVETLQNVAARGASQKASSLKYAWSVQGESIRNEANTILKRQEEGQGTLRVLQKRISETLLAPLRGLPGHEQPFELQAALIRILQPHVESRVSSSVRDGLNTAGRWLSQIRNSISGSPGKLPAPLSDPAGERDRQDLQKSRELLEQARQSLIAFARKRARDKHPLFLRLYKFCKQDRHLPMGDQLQKRLEEHYHEGRARLLQPVVQAFEKDFEGFCRGNPELMKALQVAIPGISVSAALAAAIFSIHSFAFLPGVTEYLVGGIAIPVFRALEQRLPQGILGTIDRFRREPLLKTAQTRFSMLRKELFLEPVTWLFQPLEAFLDASDMSAPDIPGRLRTLDSLWEEFLQKRGLE